MADTIWSLWLQSIRYELGVPFYVIYRQVFLFGVIEFAIPVISLLVISVKLLLSLRSSRQRRMDMRQCQGGCQNGRGVNMMIIVVMIVFMICQTGYALAMIPIQSDLPHELHCTCMAVMKICLILNSSVNVFIYVAFNREFRQILCHGWRVDCCVKASEGSTTNYSSHMGLNEMGNTWQFFEFMGLNNRCIHLCLLKLYNLINWYESQQMFVCCFVWTERDYSK